MTFPIPLMFTRLTPSPKGLKLKTLNHFLVSGLPQGHQDSITGLAFSGDGVSLATACEDRNVRVFRIAELLAKNLTSRRRSLTRTAAGVAFGANHSQVLVLTRGMFHLEV